MLIGHRRRDRRCGKRGWLRDQRSHLRSVKRGVMKLYRHRSIGEIRGQSHLYRIKGSATHVGRLLLLQQWKAHTMWLMVYLTSILSRWWQIAALVMTAEEEVLDAGTVGVFIALYSGYRHIQPFWNQTTPMKNLMLTLQIAVAPSILLRQLLNQ